ncbi:uncharacterized protein Veg [Texcoconibacillus texcoconensis]|uniref:Uncharacterized protein Veg n=1 Tax=Texcoconibacillus texcoconensis TaxID=1095777 RepID=A0A840QUC8_9BACI|nr:uncharacterized protein Veg [Texcoconibacillus texcoconensis]
MKTIKEIKRSLEENLGRTVTVKANGGRRKTIERTGMLEKTYPSVFVVRLDQDQYAFERVSYSYTDLLTKSVEVSLNESSEPKSV